jgi:phosphomannomutase
VIFAGTVPTPALAYYASIHKIPAVMVTGSHIPFDRNGLKFYSSKGEISKSDEQKILEAEIKDSEEYTSTFLPSTSVSATHEFLNRYKKFFSGKPLQNMRVGIYEHSSVARDVLANILSELGANIFQIGRTTEFVAIDTEAIQTEDLQMSRNWVRQFNLDALVSADGDGDRPMIADENGDWLRGDVVGLLCAQAMEASVVVTPVSSNTAIELSRAFKRVIRTKIGSPFVIEGMRSTRSKGTIIGFEANGGVLLGSEIHSPDSVLMPLLTRDSILPIVSILCEARYQNISLSNLVAKLPARFTFSDRIEDFAQQKSQQLLKKLNKNPNLVCEWLDTDLSVREINTVDGLRLILSNHDIVHIRPSGNAPELRCYAESESPLRSNKLVKNLLSKIQSFT